MWRNQVKAYLANEHSLKRSLRLLSNGGATCFLLISNILSGNKDVSISIKIDSSFPARQIHIFTT